MPYIEIPLEYYLALFGAIIVVLSLFCWRLWNKYCYVLSLGKSLGEELEEMEQHYTIEAEANRFLTKVNQGLLNRINAIRWEYKGYAKSRLHKEQKP